MLIPRLKSGGTIAQVVNEIIDHLPRLQVQNTPQIRVSQTPRGQLITVKPPDTGGKPIVPKHPFQVSPVEGSATQVDVYYGLVGGKEVFEFPTQRLTITTSARIVVSWKLELTKNTSGGVSEIAMTTESLSDPLTLENIQGEGIFKKVMIAAVNISPEGLSVSQYIVNHLGGLFAG